MGRTVYGVDLEESPFGGLIRKLLTEEELDMIADGGTAAGHGVAPDGGSDDSDETGTSDADDETDDLDESPEDSGEDAGDEDDWSVSDETDGSSGEVDDAASPTGAELSDSLGGGSSSSPPPSTAPDDRPGGYGSPGSGGFGGSSDFGGGFDEFDDDEESGGVGGFLSAHKWLLLKVAVGLAALAAVGVVVWRYRDKLSGAVPGRGGEDADDGFDVDAGDESTSRDVSPARRRAKVDEDDGETPPPDGRDDVDIGDDADLDDERTAPGERPGARPPRDPAEGVGSPGEDVDMGALVGLGTLAVIAALVRKFDEERNRPHDPLVDGPLDEDEDDDDQ